MNPGPDLAPIGPATRLGLTGLILVVTLLALLAAVFVPLGRGPDEQDHLQYIAFILDEGRLPDVSREEVGQDQHPPLPYALSSLALAALRGVDRSMGDVSEHGQVIAGRMTTFAPGARDDRAWDPQVRERIFHFNGQRTFVDLLRQSGRTDECAQ